MPKFRIDVTEYITGRVGYHYIVEAETHEEAKEVFKETADGLDMLDWELLDYASDSRLYGEDNATIYHEPELVEEGSDG